MKKLSILFAIAFISLTSLGQELDNEFYFRFGYSNPAWSQFGMEEDDWGNDVSKIGATFELGSIFLIPPLPRAENMAFGINVDYLYTTFGNFSMSEGGYEANLGVLRIGSKVGPSFTYSPVDKMAFDVYLKADIAWASAAVLYEDAVDDADDYYLGYGDVGLSTGFNFRYGLLMLGVEYNTISPKLESDDFSGEYLGNVNDDGDKSPLPCMNFTIGMSF